MHTATTHTAVQLRTCRPATVSGWTALPLDTLTLPHFSLHVRLHILRESERAAIDVARVGDERHFQAGAVLGKEIFQPLRFVAVRRYEEIVRMQSGKDGVPRALPEVKHDEKYVKNVLIYVIPASIRVCERFGCREQNLQSIGGVLQ
jgi:hypothetical protein